MTKQKKSKNEEIEILNQREKIFKNISKIMSVKKISLKELHNRSGINYTQLSRYFDLSVDIGLKNLLRICRGLDCTLSDLVEFKSDVKEFDIRLNEVYVLVKSIYEKMSQNE